MQKLLTILLIIAGAIPALAQFPEDPNRRLPANENIIVLDPRYNYLLPVNADPPAVCTNGQSYFNTTSQTVRLCVNGVWGDLGVGTGGGGITGTANIIAKFTGPSTVGNSSVQDDGVTVSNSENVSVGTNALLTSYLNSSSGTVAFTLTKLDNNSQAIQILTTDTTSVYGICVVGCGTAAASATALIAVAGQTQCIFDNQTVIRDFVVASTTTAGDCSDAGATEPNGVQIIGRVVTLNAGVGTSATIEIFSPDTFQATIPVKTFTVTNANPGTLVNELVKITGAPSAATVSAITDTGGIIGICSGGCGNSGSATVIQAGSATCVFDGATTAGDYVQISSTNAGQCHDAGATYPVPGQVVGRVTSTNGSSGSYGILVFPPESSNPASASIATGTTNDIVKYTGANAIGASGCTIDSSNNMVCPGYVQTGTAALYSGEIIFTGHTAGSQGFGVLDSTGGTAILYLLPTAGASGTQFMEDSGSVTCPTLAPGSPTTCHQLVWATPTGTGVTSVATTSPITGGTITSTGTIACPTCLTATTPTNHAILLGQGTQAVGTVASLGTTTTVLHGNASGDPTFGSVVAGDIGANAVGNAALAVVQTRRACIIDNDTQSSTALTAAQFSGHCIIPYAATIVEVDVSGGTQTLTGSAAAPTFTGTSSIQIGKHGVTNNTALLSAALATVSGVACALTSTSGTCLFDNGITSSNTVTIATTSISAGDELYVSAATADAAQTWYTVAIIYTVN